MDSRIYKEKYKDKLKVWNKMAYKKRGQTVQYKLQAKGHRLKKYWPGTTWKQALENYNKLLENQNFSCAICKKHQSHFSRSLAVDHSHKTGKVRGALCYRCNRLYVSIHTIETATEVVLYLKKYDKEKC